MSSHNTIDHFSFPPQFMNTSRVTNRGGTYNSKSNQTSTIKSLPSQKEYIGSNKRTINSNLFSFHTEQILPSSIHSSQNFTNKKVPTYREEEESLLKSHIQKRNENSLLYSQLSKRTSNSYQPKQRQSLFQPLFRRQRMLNQIEQQHRTTNESMLSVSSIDTEISNRISSSTDISES